MTAPVVPPPSRPAAPESPRAAWLSPRYVLPVLGVLLVLAILFTPQSSVGRAGDRRLTTRSAESQGARGLYETLQRLGWRVERRDTPYEGTLDTNAVHAVLGPVVDPTAAETHRLLEAVRRGASLVYVIEGRQPIADSLRVRASRGGGRMALDSAAVRRACGGASAGGVIDWPGGMPFLLSVVRTGPSSLRDDTVFVRAIGTRAAAASAAGTADSAPESGQPSKPEAIDRKLGDATRDRDAERMPQRGDPAAIGFTLGRGRVVVLSDPDLLRNDVLRTCRWNLGLTAVRMIEWAAHRPGAPLTRVIFDEYHQGYGRHASVMRATREFLTTTAVGRALLQLVVASLVLLVALMPRPIAPVPRASFERRSPLEHVGALSRAYEQIGATRLAARRLVRGVRRRHAHGSWRTGSDEAFLRSLTIRHPSLAPDVALLLDATARPLPPAEFVKVGASLETIERTLHER